jgi:micrococcal nuclease
VPYTPLDEIIEKLAAQTSIGAEAINAPWVSEPALSAPPEQYPLPSGLDLVDGVATIIVDGDTISEADLGKLRYLGIDTPEIGMPYADRASFFNQGVTEGRRIKLEYDLKQRDVYGRVLAYVYVDTPTGWRMINVELVRAGLARPMTIPPNEKYRADIQAALEEALRAKRGIWSGYDPRVRETYETTDVPVPQRFANKVPN